ncbi:hypothetical protein Emed_003619 [Eimeria media]
MYQTPVEAFGGLPYPEFPHMLFACFPLLVLVICVHVVSADSVAPGMLGVGLGAASSLLREAASGLSTLFSRGPLGAPKALREKPALVLLLAPLVSFCCFRLLPLLLRSETTAAADVCLSGVGAFSPFHLEGKYSSTAAAFLALYQQLDLSPLLLHAFYCSSSSGVMWLLVAPLMLFSAALLLQQAKQQQQWRPTEAGAGASAATSFFFALQLLLLLPVLSGVLLVLFLSLAGFDDVCISGFMPLLFSINFLAFAADPPTKRSSTQQQQQQEQQHQQQQQQQHKQQQQQLQLLLLCLCVCCVQQMDVGVVGEGWGSLASVRWFSSCVCFCFFLFEPALYDVLLLAAAAAAAALAAAAASCTWTCALAAAAAGAATAAAAGATATATTAAGRSAAAATVTSLPLSELLGSPGGMVLSAVAAAAAVGIACNSKNILLSIMAAKRRPEGVWQLLAVTVGLALCFLGLPFSLRTMPRSLLEFFFFPRPALYSILLTQHDVVLGAIAAKLCAFWLPIYFFAPHPRLKKVLAAALATCILVGMASSLLLPLQQQPLVLLQLQQQLLQLLQQKQLLQQLLQLQFWLLSFGALGNSPKSACTDRS